MRLHLALLVLCWLSLSAHAEKKEYVRYWLEGDEHSGWEVGRCSATAVTLPKKLLPNGYCQVLVTAAHCLETGFARALGSHLVRRTARRACSGTNAAGINLGLRTSKDEKFFGALAVVPHEHLLTGRGPDVGLFVVACGKEVEATAFEMRGPYEMSTKDEYRMPGPISSPARDHALVGTFRGFSDHYQSFVGGKSTHGDSGSPLFLDGKLTGVLHGSSPELGTLVSMGTLAKTGETATSDLQGYVEKMFEGLECVAPEAMEITGSLPPPKSSTR